MTLIYEKCTVCGEIYIEELRQLEHSYGNEWLVDEECHWHECACAARGDEASHRFKWVIDIEATTETAGEQHQVL